MVVSLRVRLLRQNEICYELLIGFSFLGQNAVPFAFVGRQVAKQQLEELR